MWQFDESAAQFPPPRSEEPAELRRAIVEELANHLSCALRREQLAGGQQTLDSARQRVLARFGDPAAVARRLWWDALWEKIMLQRIVTTACVVLAAVSCLALLLTWQSLTRQQDLLASWQTTSETQAREQRELFEKLLAQSEKQAQANADSLRELQALAAGNQEPSEWNPIELRFVAGTEDGPPVEGVRVYMSLNETESRIPALQGTSDEQGVVRFKQVHYGTYSLQVGTPDRESLRETFVLQPGERPTRTIVCPTPPQAAQLGVRVAWPEDLEARGLWIQFDNQFVVRPVNDQHWRGSSSLLSDDGYRSTVLIEPSGLAHATPHFSIDPYNGRNRRNRLSTARLDEPLIDPSNTLLWPDEEYVVNNLLVLLPVADESLTQRHRQPMEEGRSRLFLAVQQCPTDWGYRIEAGVDGAPGMLWLTPTPEAVETVKERLAEFDAMVADADEGEVGIERAAE